jgi:hypothetical protein
VKTKLFFIPPCEWFGQEVFRRCLNGIAEQVGINFRIRSADPLNPFRRNQGFLAEPISGRDLDIADDPRLIVNITDPSTWPISSSLAST